MVTEDAVFEAVKEIIDPEVGINIVDMGLIYGVDIEEDTVNITMTLTSPGMSPRVDNLSMEHSMSPSSLMVLRKSMSMSFGRHAGRQK